MGTVAWLIMCQNTFATVLRPGPHRRSSECSPDLLVLFGGHFLAERVRRGYEKEGRERKGRFKAREGEGKGEERVWPKRVGCGCPQVLLTGYVPALSQVFSARRS